MYIERRISKNVTRLFKQYPIVTITGPRQSGKSTLCEKLFPDLPIVSLEDLDNREYAANDPRGFLKRCGDRAVIDEIQRVPQLLSYLQTKTDKEKKNGQYVLTGSAQLELMECVTQTLAGRTALVRLLPFTLEEISDVEDINVRDARKVIYRGFYPRIVVEGQNPSEAYAFYTRTYIERDVRQITQIQDQRLFEIFLKLCAGRTGQLVNFSELAGECGIDNKTAKKWLSVLESGYIVKTIRPYYRNLNKRLVKTPKLYFLDTGLACYLLGVREADQLENHPLYGALFETYVVGELMKKAYNRIQEDDLYFFRDNRGREVDVVHDNVSYIDAMEIKSGETVNDSFFKGLDYLETLSAPIGKRYLVYGGDESYTRKGTIVQDWKSISGFDSPNSVF